MDGPASSSGFAPRWSPRREGRPPLIEGFRAAMDPAEASKPVPPVAKTMLGFGVFVMTRRQMLGIKNRAEGRQETGLLAGAWRRRTRRTGVSGRSAAATLGTLRPSDRR